MAGNLFLLLHGSKYGPRLAYTPRCWLSRYRNPKSVVPDYQRSDESSDLRPKKTKIKGEILYGHHPILSALLSGHRSCHRVFISNRSQHDVSDIDRISNLARDKNVDIITVSDDTLDYLCTNRPHQGVCMDVSKYTTFDEKCDFYAETLRGCRTLVYLHSINDPMNMGAILRTCAYFGVDRVTISERNSCRLSPVVSRASAGAMENVRIVTVAEPHDFVQRLRASGWTTVGTGVGADKQRLSDFRASGRVALILGNEGHGLPSRLLSLCDKTVTIPSVPVTSRESDLDSLNVSVAAGILIYYVTIHKNK